jgi:hypothetical protein
MTPLVYEVVMNARPNRMRNRWSKSRETLNENPTGCLQKCAVLGQERKWRYLLSNTNNMVLQITPSERSCDFYPRTGEIGKQMWNISISRARRFPVINWYRGYINSYPPLLSRSAGTVDEWTTDIWSGHRFLSFLCQLSLHPSAIFTSWRLREILNVCLSITESNGTASDDPFLHVWGAESRKHPRRT